MNLDSIIKVSGAFLAVSSLAVGLYEYSANNAREFRTNFFKQQNLTYEQILDDLGVIAYTIGDTTHTTEFKKAEDDFEKVYFGKLNLYQNLNIELQTDTLYDEINKFKEQVNINHPDSTTKNTIQTTIDDIQERIYFLAQECKRSLKQTYRINNNANMDSI